MKRNTCVGCCKSGGGLGEFQVSFFFVVDTVVDRILQKGDAMHWVFTAWGDYL